MALTNSMEIPLGTLMPAFTLSDPHDYHYASNELVGRKGTLIIFTCNHCPYAQAVWDRIVDLAKVASSLEINTVAINPNIHPDYPDDSPENMIAEIERRSIHFPYLVDDSQNVARAYKAQCTPDIFLFNANQKLTYHGRVDDNWKDESKVTRHELKEAIENLAAGRAVSTEQHPCMGCSIKWRR